MLVPLGIWVAVIGYTVLYSGVIKLSGGTCSIGDAFRGRCTPAAPKSAGPPAKVPSSSPQAAAAAQRAGLPSAYPVGLASS